MKELNNIITTNKVPNELIITFNDMHGLWGGTSITVRGDGTVESQTKGMGAPENEVTRRQIDDRELVDVIELLVELKAWEQYTADEPPVAGESRAYLTIRLKDRTSSVWERVNEMPANNRLIQIKTKLEKN